MVNLPTLGSRGQGWVWGQFILAGAVIIATGTGPSWPWVWLRAVGLILAAIGAGFGTWSLFVLGESLTPYPAPRQHAKLVQHGPFGIVRHPVYGAVLIALLGIVFTGSWWGCIPLAALFAWWMGKTQIEEQFLRQRYPDYELYCQRVRFRLIPYVI